MLSEVINETLVFDNLSEFAKIERRNDEQAKEFEKDSLKLDAWLKGYYEALNEINQMFLHISSILK
jgi:hypothetical protein